MQILSSLCVLHEDRLPQSGLQREALVKNTKFVDLISFVLHKVRIKQTSRSFSALFVFCTLFLRSLCVLQAVSRPSLRVARSFSSLCVLHFARGGHISPGEEQHVRRPHLVRPAQGANQANLQLSLRFARSFSAFSTFSTQFLGLLRVLQAFFQLSLLLALHSRRTRERW